MENPFPKKIESPEEQCLGEPFFQKKKMNLRRNNNIVNISENPFLKKNESPEEQYLGEPFSEKKRISRGTISRRTLFKKHRKNCECCPRPSFFKGHNVIVNVIVLNCQKCNQCLKCQVSGHKSLGLGLLFEDAQKI